MSIILNIETSNKNCSVSVSESGNIIGLEEQCYEQYSHSKYLHVFIDKLFKKTKLSPSDFEAISVKYISKFTPRLMLPALSIGIFFE